MLSALHIRYGLLDKTNNCQIQGVIVKIVEEYMTYSMVNMGGVVRVVGVTEHENGRMLTHIASDGLTDRFKKRNPPSQWWSSHHVVDAHCYERDFRITFAIPSREFIAQVLERVTYAELVNHAKSLIGNVLLGEGRKTSRCTVCRLHKSHGELCFYCVLDTLTYYNWYLLVYGTIYSCTKQHVVDIVVQIFDLLCLLE